MNYMKYTILWYLCKANRHLYLHREKWRDVSWYFLYRISINK